ncbi:MAG TPA: 2OG-Fe(II) oxygenase [Burkholderiaceae bacterium]
MEQQSSTQTDTGAKRQQYISVELRNWIVQQAQAGVAPEAVLEAMKSSGWHEDVAMQALEETLRAHLEEQQKAQARPPHEALPVPVPEPSVADSPSRLRVLDRDVTVLMQMKQPRIVVFSGLLTEAECDQIIALASPRMARSETVDNQTGGSEVNGARTSRGMFFERGETGVIDRLERRIAALLNWPVENGEGLQVLHYKPGAEYKPHYDYFDPVHPGSASILKRGGQRVGTLLLYLNTPKKGGGTTFPDVGVEIAPIKGNAVYFSYDRAHVDTRSLHGGAPVIEGEKWVATKWLREREFI